MSQQIVIRPRSGVAAWEVAHFLVTEFQRPLMSGNPLINATITIEPDPTEPDPAEQIAVACSSLHHSFRIVCEGGHWVVHTSLPPSDTEYSMLVPETHDS